MATSNAAAERHLRLLAEQLIAGETHDPPASFADLESFALALAGGGAVDGDVAMGLVAAVVDALAVRGAAWLEPVAVDLDVARLHEAVGSSRPELRSVVGVGTAIGDSGLLVTSVAMWDDRTEARLVDAGGAPAPSIVLDAVLPGERRLEVGDGRSGSVVVELDRGVAGAPAVVVASVGDYLEGLESWAAGEARRNADDVDHLNRLRRRLQVTADALAADGAEVVGRFDARVATLASSPSVPPALVEVIPLARRAGARWLVGVERWSDHWRLVLDGHAGRGRWTAVSGDERFGGGPLGMGIVRFDPALAADWSTVQLTWWPDGAAAAETIEVRR